MDKSKVNYKEPKFEKVDAHIIRIIVEKANEVPLAQLLENRKKLLEQKEQLRKDVLVQEKMIDQTIQNIDEILAEAKKLGIVAKPKKAGLNIPKGSVLYKDKK